MKILAIDTATPSCSVALVDGDQLMGETTLVNNDTHARHVMVLIDRVLEMSGASIKDVDGFAATHGPGTFTGLRIGMSTLMGLADAGEKPIVGVSSLAALARQTDSSMLICPMIDARRKEVYFALHRLENQRLTEIRPATVGPLEQALDAIDAPCRFIGGGARLHADAIRERIGSKASFAPWFQNTIRAATVAHLSRERLANYDPARDRERFRPLYLRPSDAEINFAAKLKTTKA